MGLGCFSGVATSFASEAACVAAGAAGAVAAGAALGPVEAAPPVPVLAWAVAAMPQAANAVRPAANSMDLAVFVT